MGGKLEITAENKCSLCKGSKCCTYITQALDTPRAKVDFEHLLWQVSHQGVEAYKDESGWYLLISAPCSHLQANGRCAIYAHRPGICRQYDNAYCEYDEPAEKGFLLHFRGYDDLLTYCRKRFKSWGR